LIRAGTLHALGPGLLVYEIQQSSDLTYRVYDWDRLPSENRKLHIEQSLAVLDPLIAVQPVPCPILKNKERKILCQSEYFRLEMIYLQASTLELDTEGKSFHLLTLIDGKAKLGTDISSRSLGMYETVLLPASAGGYFLQAEGGVRFLMVSVPSLMPQE
jgi:mannose-6-phosphate isomerase